MTLLFYIPLTYFGLVKYHPVIELLGAGRFKMGEMSSTFLNEIRMFAKNDDESSADPNFKKRSEMKVNFTDASAKNAETAKIHTERAIT